MMRRFFFALLLSFASRAFAAEPPAVPQAVAALQHLRPRTDQGPVSWTAGPYQYDASGNIQGIGSEAYVYDKLGRLKSATLRGPDMTSLQTQSFDYDAYGNLTGTSKLGQTVSLPTAAGTNRLETLGYDASGNVITAGTLHYSYDAVGMLNTVHVGTAAQPRIIYAYTADDERLFAFDVSTSTTHWTLRGLDNKVLRDFKQVGSTWSVDRDYIYRDGLLLAALKSSGAVEHYTLDHLGTPRLITDAAGHKVGYHVYWPFGEEWSPGTPQEASPLKFTAHERDADPTGGSAPLDYMHARYYGAGWGRFLGVDPTWDSADVVRPQSWDRYSYVTNNPVRMTDDDGKNPVVVLVGIAIVGGLLLSGDVANAPAPGDHLVPNEGPASAIRGAVKALALAGAGNGATQTALNLLNRGLSRSEAGARSTRANDNTVAEIKGLPASKRPATTVGATNRSTGETTVGSSSPGPKGCCAEVDAARKLGGNAKDIQFSAPIRPRTGEPVPVCKNCQKIFDPKQFPKGTQFEP